MHLVSDTRPPLSFPSYQKKLYFTRAYSLPYIFRMLRIDRDLTKKALAAKIGVREDYLSRVEDGSRFPTLNFCLACGKEFGFNPNWVKVKWVNALLERMAVKLRQRLEISD